MQSRQGRKWMIRAKNQVLDGPRPPCKNRGKIEFEIFTQRRKKIRAPSF